MSHYKIMMDKWKDWRLDPDTTFKEESSLPTKVKQVNSPKLKKAKPPTNAKRGKEFIKESSWDREFGEPLPTLKDVTEKHQREDEIVVEGPDDKRFVRRALVGVVKAEAQMRKAMQEIEQAFLRDPRPENMKLSKDIKKSYKDNVTKFMRDSVQMIKKMK